MALRAYLGGFVVLRTGLVKREQIPHEPGEWMDLRLLGWRDLDAARRARQTDSYASLREMGGDLYKMIQETRAEVKREDSGTDDPLQTYDLGTVLALGVAAWSYDAPVSAETLGALDRETAEWAARVIVGAKIEREDDRKNA